MGTRLFDNEKVLLDTRPCVVSFFGLYLPSLYLTAASAACMAHRQDIVAFAARLPLAGSLGDYPFYAALAAVVILPGLFYSWLKINFRYLILSVLLTGLAVYARGWYLPAHPGLAAWLPGPVEQNLELAILLVAGMLGLASTEAYRRSHHYVITNARMFTEAGILRRRSRMLMLSKVNDLYKDTGLLGTLFGYAAIIPLTASGLGMGSDMALAAGSVGKKFFGAPSLGLTLAGGHSIQVPKTRSHEVFFGVRKPNAVMEAVMEVLCARELSGLAGAAAGEPVREAV